MMKLSYHGVPMVSWPCDFEFTSKCIGQQTHEPRVDWQVENLEICPKALFMGVSHIVNCEVGA
ncbi:unnamed protein product [Prunus armeniaca]